MAQAPVDSATQQNAQKWPLSKAAILLLCLLFPIWGGVVIHLILRKSAPDAARFAIRAMLIMLGVSVMVTIVAVGVGMSAWKQGDGEIVVFAPATEALVVNVDGTAKSVPAGRTVAIPLSHGDHSVKMTGKAGPREFKITVPDGTYRQVLPYTGQCFVVVNVTNYWKDRRHAAKDRLPELLTDIKKLDGAAPFDPPTHYTAFDDIPKTGDKDRRYKLLRPVPCDLLSGPSEAIVRAAFSADMATP